MLFRARGAHARLESAMITLTADQWLSLQTARAASATVEVGQPLRLPRAKLALPLMEANTRAPTTLGDVIGSAETSVVVLLRHFA